METRKKAKRDEREKVEELDKSSDDSETEHSIAYTEKTTLSPKRGRGTDNQSMTTSPAKSITKTMRTAG